MRSRQRQRKVSRAPVLSTTQRGYGYDWVQLSGAFRVNYPWCTLCLLRGSKTLAQCVDHIIPHKRRESLRMDWRNLQSLCNRCHNKDKAQLDRSSGYHVSQWWELLRQQPQADDPTTISLLPQHVRDGINCVKIPKDAELTL